MSSCPSWSSGNSWKQLRKILRRPECVVTPCDNISGTENFLSETVDISEWKSDGIPGNNIPWVKKRYSRIYKDWKIISIVLGGTCGGLRAIRNKFEEMRILEYLGPPGEIVGEEWKSNLLENVWRILKNFALDYTFYQNRAPKKFAFSFQKRDWFDLSWAVQITI